MSLLEERKGHIVGGGKAKDSASLISFLSSFGIHPTNLDIYKLAFTHSSYNSDEGTKHHDYERLEFLGDGLIGSVVSTLIYFSHPTMQEGQMSILKSSFVRRESEASYALKLKLDEMILVGKSYQDALQPAVLEDVFEAFVGALVVDQGLEFATHFLIDLLKDDIANASIVIEDNPKSALQEMMQADYKQSVTYRILAESGPSHEKTFVAGVYFDGVEIGRGSGKNKKEAESEAARDALSKRSGHN